jgi:hypothetical protein
MLSESSLDLPYGHTLAKGSPPRPPQTFFPLSSSPCGMYAYGAKYTVVAQEPMSTMRPIALHTMTLCITHNDSKRQNNWTIKKVIFSLVFANR